MVIVFNKKFGVKLIYFQIIYNLSLSFLTSVFGLPHFMSYVTDIVTLLLLFVIRKKYVYAFTKSGFKSTLYVIVLFWGLASLSALFNLVPFLLYIWALRNVFRFYIFFLACGTLLEAEDVDRIFGILYKFQYLNIVLCAFEYFVLGCKGDNLGGIFGIGAGCNGPLNLYLYLLLTWALSKYMAKKLKLSQLLVVLISAMGIGALAELKVLFLEFAVIAVIIFFLFKPSFKHTFFIVAGTTALVVALTILGSVFQESLKMFTDKEIFLRYANMQYHGKGTISRTMALQQINEYFFHNNILRILFGYGLGSCETSTFFQSDFFRQYGDVVKFRGFSHAMFFLETGLTGLLSYLLFFVDTARHAFMKMKTMANHKYHSVIVIVISVLAITTTSYNSSLRTEGAYLIFFVLAIVVVDVRSMQKKI